MYEDFFPFFLLFDFSHFFPRLRLATFDSRGKLLCSRSTGYQLLTLEKDQVSLMVFWFWCERPSPTVHLLQHSSSSSSSRLRSTW